MRITNKIMQNNNLANINTNKLLQDKLSTQMASEKKINRPSDDPVVAIRALRLRSNVTEITQYYSRNIPDAESWLKVTEESLKTLSNIVTDMQKLCTKGAKDYLTFDDRQTIIEQLKALADEVYTTGDADYAGRYVFTGYRTDTSLSFPSATEMQYRITEQLDKDAIDKVTVITTKSADGTTDVMDMTANNYGTINVQKQDIKEVETYRFRLAYGNCDGVAPTLEYDGKRQADGTIQFQTITPTIKHDYESPYEAAASATDGAIFVPETGELLLSKDAYDKLMATKDNAATSDYNEGEIRITYDKSQWIKGDLRPQHYFYCETNPDDPEAKAVHNPSYLTANAERQEIEYDVGFNQTIRINSTADECFKHGIGREVEDLVNAMQDVVDTEKIVNDLKDLLKTASEADAEEIQKKLDVAQEVLERKSHKAQKMFEHGITVMQGHLDDTNLSLTNNGTRSRKLELIENRMQSQKTTFEELQSVNEDIDIAEVIIHLSSAKLTYEAALMATGKVAQTSLLQYI